MPTKPTKSKAAASRPLTTADAKKAVNIDQLSKTVGTAVSKALARQNLSKIRGPILCGIIYRPSSGTFTPLFKEQSQF